MQFESLKIFCDVARHRSFSHAAAANKVSQSAASQVVLQLEKRLGVQLIDRSTRPLQLTELGKVYYDGCKGLAEQYGEFLELEASIRTAQVQLDQTVKVAAIYSVGLGDMGQYVERFMTQLPNAKVQIEYLHPNRVYEKVLEGTVDFGLVSFPRKVRELTSLPWREEEMVVVCSPGHRLAKHPAVEPAELAGEKFIGFDKDLVIRRKVDRLLRDQGVAVEVVMAFDSIENIKKAIEIAAGVALLPEPTLRREVQAGTLVARPLLGCRFVRPLGIIHRRHHKLSSTAAGFLNLLQHADGNGEAAERPGSRRNGTAASRPTQLGTSADGDGKPSRTNGAHRARAGATPASKRND
jgi:DNA-binding transcriptional LysR family regulator